MSKLGDYYNELNPTYTPQGKGEIISSESLPLYIKPGSYRDTSLFPRTFCSPFPLILLATRYLIQIGNETIPWPTLLPQNECPLITTRLKDVHVDIFNHNHDNLQPVISCDECAKCPAFNMCQGTNISKIINNSQHKEERAASPFNYSQEALSKSIFKQALDQMLRRVNWSQLCLAAMRDVARAYDKNQPLMPQIGSSFNNLNTQLSSTAIFA